LVGLSYLKNKRGQAKGPVPLFVSSQALKSDALLPKVNTFPKSAPEATGKKGPEGYPSFRAVKNNLGTVSVDPQEI